MYHATSSNCPCLDVKRLSTFQACPWDEKTQLNPHRLQFFFAHDPRFALFHGLAATNDGHNMVSHLLHLHEETLDPEHFGNEFDEALLHYVAHLIYIALVESKTEASARERGAAEGKITKRNDLPDYQEITTAGHDLSLSPFGVHYHALVHGQGLSALTIDVEHEVRQKHSGLAQYSGYGRGCCGPSRGYGRYGYRRRGCC